jgi:hypothetical protein
LLMTTALIALTLAAAWLVLAASLPMKPDH